MCARGESGPQSSGSVFGAWSAAEGKNTSAGKGRASPGTTNAHVSREGTRHLHNWNFKAILFLLRWRSGSSLQRTGIEAELLLPPLPIHPDLGHIPLPGRGGKADPLLSCPAALRHAPVAIPRSQPLGKPLLMTPGRKRDAGHQRLTSGPVLILAAFLLAAFHFLITSPRQRWDVAGLSAALIVKHSGSVS